MLIPPEMLDKKTDPYPYTRIGRSHQPSGGYGNFYRLSSWLQLQRFRQFEILQSIVSLGVVVFVN
jgi:hypothetical protein